MAGEQASPPLPSSIRNGRSASCAKRTSGPPLLIGLTTACFRHRRRPLCAPLQFPLKSYGFSGAETARKRFLLWKMGFSAAKIAPSPPYTPPGTIETRKGFVPQFTMVVPHLRTVPPLAARCSVAAHCASLRVLATSALRASDVRKLTRGFLCLTGLTSRCSAHCARFAHPSVG